MRFCYPVQRGERRLPEAALLHNKPLFGLFLARHQKRLWGPPRCAYDGFAPGGAAGLRGFAAEVFWRAFAVASP
jgi:hypothetical protein